MERLEINTRAHSEFREITDEVQAAVKKSKIISGLAHVYIPHTTAGLTNWEQLPLNARRYLERVQALIGAPIDMVSTGPDRVHTILLRHPFRA